jgi:hypothetical protein
VLARISKRDRDSTDALAGALDALIHEAVRVALRVLTGRVLVVSVGIVFVRPGVGVGVACLAVAMQIARDLLVGNRRHGCSG